jgi:hypothetical protein
MLVWGGHVTKGSKPTLKAGSKRSEQCGMKSAQEGTSRPDPTATSPAIFYSRDVNISSHMGRRIRRSSFRPHHQRVVPISTLRKSLSLPPVHSHLEVHAEQSISDTPGKLVPLTCDFFVNSRQFTLRNFKIYCSHTQVDLVDGWAAKMEGVGLHSILPGN